MLVGSPIIVPLGGLVVNLFSRFSWHGGTYESNHFLEQRRRIMMITTPISTCNTTTKVKRPREDGFCGFCFSFVWVLFCGGSFYLHFRLVYNYFYHKKSNHYLQIKHNRKFLLQRERLHHNLGFFCFCHNFGKIAKKENI